MTGEIGDIFIEDENDDVLRSSNDMCFRIDSDTTVEVATERVFVVGHINIFDDLRQLAKSFCLIWQFCTARSGKTINCNRANRKSKYTKMGIRRSTSVNCACKWSIRFLGVVKCKHTTSDSVVILIYISSH